MPPIVARRRGWVANVDDLEEPPVWRTPGSIGDEGCFQDLDDWNKSQDCVDHTSGDGINTAAEICDRSCVEKRSELEDFDENNPLGKLKAHGTDLSGSMLECAEFVPQSDGSWLLCLPLQRNQTATSDFELHTGDAELRILLPGRAPFIVAWPASVDAAQVEKCSARLSKRRCELSIRLPASVATGHGNAVDDETPGGLPQQPAQNVSVASGSSVPQSQQLVPVSAQPKPSTTKAPKYAVTKANQKADADALQKSQECILHSAAALGDVTRIQELLAARVDPCAVDELGASALEKACAAGQVAAAEELLRHGADAKRGPPFTSSTPLHRAVGAGGEAGRKLIRLLRGYGASTYVRDKAGRTPRDIALAFGQQVPPELE